MGALSRELAAINAKEMEAILLKSIDECNMKVITFCQKNIYPLYEKYVTESDTIYQSRNAIKIQKVFGK